MNTTKFLIKENKRLEKKLFDKIKKDTKKILLQEKKYSFEITNEQIDGDMNLNLILNKDRVITVLTYSVTSSAEGVLESFYEDSKEEQTDELDDLIILNDVLNYFEHIVSCFEEHITNTKEGLEEEKE